MAEYAVAVIMTVSLTAFAELIAYNGGEERGHKLAISVILLYSIISPLVPLFEDLKDFSFSELDFDKEEFTDGAYLEVGEAAFREGIARAVSEKFGLDEEKIVVTIFGFDFETMRAERINITLLGRGIELDFREIEAYVEKNGLGECEVKYAIK